MQNEREMMIKRIMICFILAIISVTFFSCKINDAIEYNDIMIVKTNTGYTVAGLSKNAKEKNSIIIPSYYKKLLNEYPINSFGLKTGWSSYKYDFKSDDLEIIYIKSILKFVGYQLFNDCPKLKKIICLSKDEPEFSILNGVFINYNNIQTYDESFYRYDSSIAEDKFPRVSVYYYSDLDNVKMTFNYAEKPGNIQYLDSLSEELYYLDFYDGTLINDMPWTPVKDGYTFVGWYKEKECINKWHFDSDKVSKIEYKESEIKNTDNAPVYAYTYDITRIYAKWERN